MLRVARARIATLERQLKDNKGEVDAARRKQRELDTLTLQEELDKERASREHLRNVVSAAENMLRVARARIATLERQLKDNKGENRHREASYEAKMKKMAEVAKTAEATIETVTCQRDALELRVKELRELVESSEEAIEGRVAEQKARADALAVALAAQEKLNISSKSRIAELEAKMKELEETVHNLRERSSKLIEMERMRCLDYIPSKETEPSDREAEIWQELQKTRMALSRTEEELYQTKADKDNFLNSLSKIAQGDGSEIVREEIATELLEKEKKIAKLQQIIEEQRENEKLMEQSMTHYENQLANLRLEVKRLRNYDCYIKDESHQELQTELLDMHMQVEALKRERTALVTAAASRALMLERHERAAELFARVTRARRDLAALIEDRSELPSVSEIPCSEITRSLSLVCMSSQETWSALRAERARVLRLESAVLAQSLQLEREGRVRTQLERRRAALEREVRRAHCSHHQPEDVTNKMPSVVQYLFSYK
ncbi:cingulin isoform X3 [Phthorimaea operculella]|nr:cingulin isoform X3 [Phthorimaea operculella]